MGGSHPGFADGCVGASESHFGEPLWFPIPRWSRRWFRRVHRRGTGADGDEVNVSQGLI